MIEVDQAMINLAQRAERVLYVCRRWNPRTRGTLMRCEECRGSITVTPSVLADRRRFAAQAGVPLIVVCDDCAITSTAARGIESMVAIMPTDEELREANE